MPDADKPTDEALAHDSPTPPAARPRPRPRPKPKPKPARKVVTHTKAGAVDIEDPGATTKPTVSSTQAKTANRMVRAVKPKG